MADHGEPPPLAEDLKALATRAAELLALRYPDRAPWWKPEQLLERNSLELLRAYVIAEEELAKRCP